MSQTHDAPLTAFDGSEATPSDEKDDPAPVSIDEDLARMLDSDSPYIRQRGREALARRKRGEVYDE